MKSNKLIYDQRSCLAIYLCVHTFRLKPEQILIEVGTGLYNKFGLEILILIFIGSYNSLRDAKIRRFRALIF
jgi:hypothetical protein